MQRSLAILRERGYECEIVEHFNFYTKRRHDLFGFADILAYAPGEVLAVQTTTTGNLPARRKKILGNEKAHKVSMAGIDIVLHGWGKKGPRGKRKLWELTETIVSP